MRKSSMFVGAGALCVALGAVGCAATKDAAITAGKDSATAAKDAAVGSAKDSAAAAVDSATAGLPKGVVSENTVEATATVTAIDQKTRRVTLKRTDGSLVKFTAGPQVRNLAQVKVGDEVKVTYYEALAFEVHKAGTAKPGTEVVEGAARAKVGEMPGAAAARATTVTATIAGIDKSAGTATLKFADGESSTIKVRNPDNLNRVAVGDLVDLIYAEALGISVEKPTKK